MPSKKELIKYINSFDGNPSVLDIGMGYANWWRYCKKAKFTGIDTAYKMVDHVKKEFPEAKLSIGSAEKLPYKDNSFDLVILAHVLSVVNEPQKALSEAQRVTVNGGEIIIINHDSKGWEWIDIPLSYLSRWVKVKLPFFLNLYLDHKSNQVIQHKRIGITKYFQMSLLTAKII
jgi:ubiquinone/menaquinone biosynthesis C-methylase UbiE